MSPAHRRYLLAETVIAAVINAVLSVAFFFLVFGRAATVPVAGAGGLIVDALPQSFMVAAMSTMVPTLLTRRRVAAGKIGPLPSGPRLPRHGLMRALAVGMAVAAVAGLAHLLVLPLTAAHWTFVNALGFKIVYGALLGAAVAAVAVRAALADT